MARTRQIELKLLWLIRPLFRVNDAFHQRLPCIRISIQKISLTHTDPLHTHTQPCTPSLVVRSSPASVNMHTSSYRADICAGCCSQDQHLRTEMAASLWSISVLTLSCLLVQDGLSANVPRAGTAFFGGKDPASGSELKQWCWWGKVSLVQTRWSPLLSVVSKWEFWRPGGRFCRFFYKQ